MNKRMFVLPRDRLFMPNNRNTCSQNNRYKGHTNRSNDGEKSVLIGLFIKLHFHGCTLDKFQKTIGGTQYFR
ncbi:hypothetical protein D3C73_860030 [compost metagenome]